MGRRISSSGGRRSSGGGFRASSRSSGFRSSSGFRTGTTRHIGSYRYRTRPYRRNYVFHSLSPTGKVIYIVLVFVMVIILFAIGG